MNDCPAESENPFTVSVHPSTLPPPRSLRTLQNVRLLDSIGIIKSLGSIPFTWCHDLSSANSWLKIIHPTIRHKHFVLSIFVDDLESTILNRSSVRFHGIRSVYIPRSFSRDHHISAILARAAKAAHVISRKRPGSELTTEQPFLAARFWVESSTECDRNLQFKTDLGFHRSNESLKRWKWNCRCSYLVRTGILIEMEIKRRGEEKSVQIKSFDILRWRGGTLRCEIRWMKVKAYAW